MLRLVARSFAYGLIGFIATPVAVFFIVLIVAHTFESHCGTPGDSGGCEMGALSIAVFSVLPGLAMGVALALIQAYRNPAK